MKYLINLTLAVIFCCNLTLSGQGQEFIQVSYKTVESKALKLNIYYPPEFDSLQNLPAILFFFGGGWVNGDPSHFHDQCVELSNLGIIAVAADYRTRSKFGTTPLESLQDAKSAMRYLKSNAEKVHIIPDRIVAAGGSAGGYLAIALATIDGFNDKRDDLSISTMPAAAVLFNPVVNTADGSAIAERFGDHAEEASPIHHIKPLNIPVLIMHGTDDKVVKYSDIVRFRNEMNNAGGDVWLVSYEDCGHGFFNKRNGDDTYYNLTLKETIKFLRNKGFLP